MRLHELTLERIEEWRQARLEAGQRKYGDAHMQRYGLVDIMEEVLDIDNLLKLHFPRIEDVEDINGAVYWYISDIRYHLDEIKVNLLDLDVILPGEVCIDERGGHRVWWSEQALEFDGQACREEDS